MPAMYPEELRDLREQNPGLQYDFRGRLIDDGGYGDMLRGWSPYKPDYGVQNPYGNLAQDVSNLFYKSDSLVDQDWDKYYRPQFGAGYDFGMGDALRNAVHGLDGYSDQVGSQMPGQYKAPPLPKAGTAYSRWDPNSNSWYRTSNNPDEFQTLGRMDDWKWGQETPH